MKKSKTKLANVSICILLGLLTFLPIRAQVSSFDSDKPVKTYTNQYAQSFNTTWDGTTFYNEWDTMDANNFNATDIASGYLQFVWVPKRILCSKMKYVTPYVLQTDIDYALGSNRGGVVIRANPVNQNGVVDLDQLQEPAGGDPGFNRDGIAFYPSADGSNMIVQFTGVNNGDSTLATRISVPMPTNLTSLMSRGTLRIEDFGTSIYVYYNNMPYIRIDLSGKTDSFYTSGTVYNSNMQIVGVFSSMVIDIFGKVAVAQRDATLRLYSTTLQFNNLIKQTLNFNKIGQKQISDPPFTISATSSSGLPVTYQIISGPATLKGDTITLTGTAGMVVVAANQPGNTETYPADQVEKNFFVENPNSSKETVQLKAYSDSWVATDSLWRILPKYADCGNYRPNKYVGMFYWLWHAYVRTHPILDVTKELQSTNGNPVWIYQDWYHGEPENGYYHPSDPWSTRRNLQLLADAGVDFIFFDFTNGDQGDLSLENFMSVALDMYNKGIPVPKISFFLNVSYNTSIPSILNRIYSHPEYDPLLFKWEGKPLLMADSTQCATECAICNDPDIKAHFTWRKTWAFQTDTIDQWRFVDDYPQRPSYHNGVAEQICVNKSMGAPLVLKTAVNNKGASYTTTGGTPTYDKFLLCPRTPYGDYFEQEWGQALAVDPSIVCVTGWNELTAGAWNFDATTAAAYNFMGKPCDQDPGHWYFVDEFNAEFNRDIEPMKDGNTDNYYYQLVSHIRKFKGMSHPDTISAPKTIVIDGNFNDWMNVTPVYKDPEGDATHRNFQNVDGSEILVNNTGRNDIIESRTTYDDNNIYFYVKTAQALSPSTDPNWMLLFIDADRSKGTGWEGYDFVVNLGVIADGMTTLKQWDGINWSKAINVPYKVNGTELELSIPRAAMMMDKTNPEFYFHWADNLQQLNNITSFFTDGDSAPDRRFNYNFSTSTIVTLPETPYKTMTIPGTVEFEDFDNGGAGVAYADATIGNSGGAYRLNESVDIESMSGGGYDVTAINSNEWLSYTVNVKVIGTVTSTIHYAAAGDENNAIIYVDGVDKSGVINFPSSGGLQTWATKDVDLQLTAGQHVLKFYIQNASGDFKLDKIDFTNKNVVYPGNGTGLNKSIWTASLGGRTWFNDSICSSIDPFIDAKWSINVSPGCNVSSNFWNMRWEGQIQPLYSELYTFYLTVKDMGRVWINNQLVVDGWFLTSSGTTISGTTALTAGQKVPIKVDFAKKANDAYIKLEWSSSSNPREDVPQNQLYPVINTTGLSDMKMSYFDVYPNPTIDKLNINSGQNNVNCIEIFDLQGRSVYKNNISFTGQKQINISLEKGCYLIKLTGNVVFETKKLIIE